ncbi:MAG: VWA domain-containing protein [Acidobacteria bacterium]|nr:VWA domain-containing protein [Acidobacteriota bacterium]
MNKTFLALFILLLVIFFPSQIYGQAGVLIPNDLTGNAQITNPSASKFSVATALSLSEMTVKVDINNQFARVKVMQIYTNNTGRVLEGKYVFLIPNTAIISDFAVWDGDVRIPGVIIEKRRANEIYEEIKQQYIDPGLLQSEEGEAAFSTKITPIQPYSTKRMELEYTEVLSVDGLKSYFSFPLRPSDFGKQLANGFKLDLTISSKYKMKDFNLLSKQYPLTFSQQSENLITASYEASQIVFQEDFAFNYSLNVPKSEIQFLAYRAPEKISPLELRDPARANPNPDGYFEASVIFSGTKKATKAKSEPRSMVLMLDTSLSMRLEKLDKSIEAIEYFLHSLTPKDNFNLVLFNDDINVFSSSPMAATTDNVEKAILFIRNSYLSGGTDLTAGLKAGLDAARKLPGNERNIVMITDGNSTLTSTSLKKITNSFNTENKQVARLYVFGIGSDTNTQVLGELVRGSNGYFNWARETEDLSFKLAAFFDKVGKPVIENIGFTSNISNYRDDFYQVYPDVDRVSYDGSRFAFVGRYRHPIEKHPVAITGTQSGDIDLLTATVKLPELDITYDHLPRLWAKARVDALLREIALNGETEEAINEIIALSKKYKFITPYTAFLAAPRSLLRPRIIKPGDPVLRVRTDESIVSIVAVLPYGETKELTYLKDEDVWETRFLAPKTMQDGSYNARLILIDKNNNSYEEEKSFIIDSRPPNLSAELSNKRIQAGRDLVVKVKADRDTRRIAARLFGAQPIAIVWDEKEKINRGLLHIPEGLPAGRYQLIITAEDFAHNSSNLELSLEVLGK